MPENDVSQNLFAQTTKVTRAQREAFNNNKTFTLWFTGLSASGKSTIAAELEARGWVFDEERKGDPWIVLLSKRFSDPTPHDREAELREVMGNYWVDLDPSAPTAR